MNGARHCRCSRVLTLLFLLAAPPAFAITPPIDRVAFAPSPGASLPIDARFTDEHGDTVRLGDMVGARPAIVVPAYYGCSNLCGIVLRGVVASLSAAGLHAGRDVDVVAVSIEPHDTPAIARVKEREIVGDSDTGWHFLTGDETAIGAFTHALGYRYVYDAAQRQYAHAAGIVIVAPEGRITDVLYGASFGRAQLIDALRAAGATQPRPRPTAAGEVRTWLLCFHYDPETGKYSFAAMNAVRAVAILALLALATYIARNRTARARRQGDRS